MLVIKLAGIPIGIDNRFSHLEHLARDYITEDSPEFTVSVTDGEIAKEREIAQEEFSDGYLEGIVAYRKIAERLPSYDAVVFHGAVLDYGGSAYVFTARSGVGKTTHTRLWRDEFEQVRYVNGDKPIIRIVGGVPYAYGTPWRGKEGYGENVSSPICAIAFIERAEENSVTLADAGECAVKFIKQTYVPNDPTAARLAMRVADRIISSVKFFDLKCNMDPEAARVAKRAMVDR